MMKSMNCISCGIETYEKDCICALCRSNISQIYKELIELLKSDKKLSPHRNGRNKRIASISKKSEAKNKVSAKRLGIYKGLTRQLV